MAQTRMTESAQPEFQDQASTWPDQKPGLLCESGPGIKVDFKYIILFPELVGAKSGHSDTAMQSWLWMVSHLNKVL